MLFCFPGLKPGARDGLFLVQAISNVRLKFPYFVRNDKAAKGFLAVLGMTRSLFREAADFSLRSK
jgi:hypothetical protein